MSKTSYSCFGINHYYKDYKFTLKVINGYMGGFIDETDLYRISVVADPKETNLFMITLFDIHTGLVVQDTSKIQVLKVAPIRVGFLIPRGNQPDYLFKLSFLESTPPGTSEANYYKQIIESLAEVYSEIPQQFVVKREGIRVNCSLPNRFSGE